MCVCTAQASVFSCVRLSTYATASARRRRSTSRRSSSHSPLSTNCSSPPSTTSSGALSPTPPRFSQLLFNPVKICLPGRALYKEQVSLAISMPPCVSIGPHYGSCPSVCFVEVSDLYTKRLTKTENLCERTPRQE